jgi:hypothetical protein
MTNGEKEATVIVANRSLLAAEGSLRWLGKSKAADRSLP